MRTPADFPYGAKPALKKESVDILKEPIPLANRPQANTEYALGDLHANTLKLAYFWGKIGVLKIPDKTYEIFCKAYRELYELLHIKIQNTRSITINDKIEITEACNNFSNALPTLSIENTDAIFSLLMGDTIFDRGCLDLLTLTLACHVMEKREQDGIQRDTVLISNHDLRFIQAIENNLHFTNTDLRLGNDAGRSGSILQRLIDAGLLGYQAIREKYVFYAQHYKAIHYTVDAQGRLTGIFGHAPINMRCIVNMASGLVRYGHEARHAALFPAEIKQKLIDALEWFNTAQKLKKIESKHMIALMDAINDLTQDAVRNFRLHQLTTLGFDSVRSGPLLNDIKRGTAGTFYDYPLHLLCWSRMSVPWDDVVLSDLPVNTYPKYANGHDSGWHHALLGSAHNLNNSLGQQQDMTKGDLTWTETPRHPVPKPDVPQFVPPVPVLAPVPVPAPVLVPAPPSPNSVSYSAVGHPVTFSPTKQHRIPAAAVMFFCNVIALTVASVIKDDALGFLGGKTFEHNLGIAMLITLASTVITYAGVQHLDRKRAITQGHTQ